MANQKTRAASRKSMAKRRPASGKYNGNTDTPAGNPAQQTEIPAKDLRSVTISSGSPAAQHPAKYTAENFLRIDAQCRNPAVTEREKFLPRNRCIIAAFFCSALILCITYAIRGIYPFGDQTILRVDLYHQYAPYLEELRSRLLSGQSLLYSWEGGLGKDFLAQMAYYTASPLSLLVLLFPQENIPEALAVLIMLKTCLCASSFAWYIREHFRRNDLSVLIFGLLYAFCAFLTCYYWNVMWLDTVYLFPVVALGLERLVLQDRKVLYYAALVLTMIVNFYLAVLVCILTAGYYLVLLFSHYTWKNDRRIFIQRTVSFAVVSVLCALTSMIVLAPVAVALGQTATSDTAFPSFSVYENLWQLLENHFLGARAAVLARNEDLPNVYTGVITMMLLPVYFFNTKIDRREKILNAAFLIFMLLCACIKPLDFLIHGLHFPSNLPHRYTFVYSFILLKIAYRGFTHLDGCRFRYVLGASALYITVVVVSEFVLVRFLSDIDRVYSNTDLALNLGLIAIYLFLLYSAQKKGAWGWRKYVLLACVFGEALFSSVQNLDETGNREAYTTYMADTEDAIDYIEEQEDGSFYRVEFRRFTTINDASLYHYNGFSQFSSLAPGGISELIQNLGIAATSNSYRYYDPTPLIDAMFGMKYVMNKDAEYPKEGKYDLVQQFGSVWLYENSRSLPLGFLVSSDITEWQTTGSQPFAVQNDFLKKACGTDGDMFTMIEADSISETYMTVTEVDGASYFNYELEDAADLTKTPTVTAEYTAQEDMYLYLYVDAANAQRFVYTTNSEKQDRELSAGRSLIDVGYISAGETVHVEFSLTKRGEFEKTYRESGTVKLYAAAYNDAVFQAAYDQLSSQTYQITEFSDTFVEGIVEADEDCVLFTSIPYTSGWSVTIDGQSAEVLSIGNDGLIGVSVPAGSHIITFRYSSGVLLPSAGISAAGAGLFVLYDRTGKKRKKKKAAVR